MSYAHEYSHPTTNYAGCNYASLKNYNEGFGRGPVAPVPTGTPSMAVQTVPAYCPNNPVGTAYPPRYNTLQHGEPYTCGGYFGIMSAYPAAAGTKCATTFTNRPCAGFINCPGVTAPLAPLTPAGVPLAPLGPGGMPLVPLTPGGFPLTPLGPGRVPIAPLGPSGY